MMGGLVNKPDKPAGPTQEELAQQAQLEAEQKQKEQDAENLRISLARQRFAGSTSTNAQTNVLG